MVGCFLFFPLMVSVSGHARLHPLLVFLFDESRYSFICPPVHHNQLVIHVFSSPICFPAWLRLSLFQSHLSHSPICPAWSSVSFSNSLSFTLPPQVSECVGGVGRASGAGGEGDDHQDHLHRGSLPGSAVQRRDVDDGAGGWHAALWRLRLPPVLSGQEKRGCVKKKRTNQLSYTL